MKIQIKIDPKTALAAGKNYSGRYLIDIDPATLSEEERKILLSITERADSHSLLGADLAVKSWLLHLTEPSAEALICGLQRLLTAAIEEAMKEKEEERKKIEREAYLADAGNWRAIPAGWKKDLIDDDTGAKIWWECYIGRPMDGGSYERIPEEAAAAADAAEEAAKKAAIAKFAAEEKPRILRQEAERAMEEEEKARKEERKQRSIAAWVAEHGSKSQRARLAEQLLPEDEAIDAIREMAFVPLQAQRYKKIKMENIEHSDECDFQGKFSCDVEAAEELSEEQYEIFRKLRDQLPAAVWVPKKHQCTVSCCHASEIRYGALAEIEALPGVVVSREFAL